MGNGQDGSSAASANLCGLENTGRFTYTPGQVGPGRVGAEPTLRGPRLGKGTFSLLLATLGAWATALRNWIGNLGFSAVWG